MHGADLAGGEVPQDARHQLLDLVLRRLTQQPNQRRHTARVLNGALVLVVLTPI